jgi:hypothetical protein
MGVLGKLRYLFLLYFEDHVSKWLFLIKMVEHHKDQELVLLSISISIKSNKQGIYQ